EGPVEGGDSEVAADLGDTLVEGDTGITGRVLDAEAGGAPMGGVTVKVLEGPSDVGRELSTTEEGRFQLRGPAGFYTVRIATDFYAPARLAGIEVREGEITYLPDLELRMDSSTMGEAVVTTYRADTNTAATQLQVRQRSAAVRDAVSSEEIRRAGDSSAASAARRVVAVTVVGGRYVYVRGLGGRYVGVTLNGAMVPQLDPYTPGVQVDLFPTDILSSLAILKSYLPELPGAFGGGALQLSTLEPPDEFQVRASIGAAYNSETTWQRGPIYRGGSRDLLGFDDGSRALPAAVRDNRLEIGGFETTEELDAATTAFNDDFRVTRRRIGLMPFDKLTLSVGHRLRFKHDRSLGVIAAAGYRLQRQRRDGAIRTVRLLDAEGTEVAARDNLRRESYQQEAQLYALGAASLELGENHELLFDTVFNQIGQDYAAIDRGIIESLDNVSDSMRGRLQFVQRQIRFHQLRGRHFLGNARINWHAETAAADRTEPDTRDFRYRPNDQGTGEVWPTNPWGADTRYAWQPNLTDDGQRIFMNLDQRDFGGGIDFTYDWRQADVVKLFAGLATSFSNRTFDVRRFQYRAPRNLTGPELALRPPAELFDNANYRATWLLREVTGPNDGFESNEELFGAYLGLQAAPHARFRFYAGARVEAFRQELVPGTDFGETQLTDEQRNEMTVNRTNIDVLPVVSARLELKEQMFVRAAYAVTVARPTPRELAPILLPNFVANRNEFGDPSLQRTRIQHVDLRWEWFPGATEVVSATAFTKLFEDPIELVILDNNRTFSYRNVGSATNFGLELEGRMGLERIHERMRGFTLGANLTLVRSQVELTDALAEVATNRKRPLAFQSPWVANASFGYQNDRASLFLYYLVFGPAIEEVGANGQPDVYHQPFHQLDLQGRYELRDGVNLGLSVKNLLNRTERFTGRSIVMRSYDPGVSVGLSLSWTH
ncbi:MAG: TonB-dependent receptor, partial [Polyangiales bacterium]